jgi:hypothetical protein
VKNRPSRGQPLPAVRSDDNTMRVPEGERLMQPARSPSTKQKATHAGLRSGLYEDRRRNGEELMGIRN